MVGYSEAGQKRASVDQSDQLPACQQTGSYRDTGLREINRDHFPEADFWPAWLNVCLGHNFR
jgi:hypothetical protein